MSESNRAGEQPQPERGWIINGQQPQPQHNLIKIIEGFGDFYMNYKNIDPPKSICSIIREYLESINMQPQPGYAKMLEEKEREIAELKGKYGELVFDNFKIGKILCTASGLGMLSHSLDEHEKAINKKEIGFVEKLEEKNEAIRELVEGLELGLKRIIQLHIASVECSGISTEQTDILIKEQNELRDLLTKYKQP